MKTHLLTVRIKSTNRLHLKAEFNTKKDVLIAANAILYSNPDFYEIEIVYIGK